MNRKLAALLIIGAWVAAVGLLLQREVFGGISDDLADVNSSIPPGAVFYSVELGGEQIGFASSTVDTVPGEGIFVQEVLEINLSVGSGTERINSRTEVMLDRSLNLRTFRKIVQGDTERYRMEGAVAGNVLELEVQTESGTHSTQIAWAPGSTMPSFLPMKLVFGGEIESGREASFRVVDTYSFSSENLAVRVFEDSVFMVPDSAVLDSATMHWSPIHYDTVHAWNTTFESATGDARVWVDDLGRVVSMTTSEGYGVSRSVYEVVYENFRRRDTSLVSGARARISRLFAREAGVEPPPIDYLSVEFARRVPAGVARGNQVAEGHTLSIETPALPARRPYRLGFRAAAINEFLEPDAIVRSDDPRIGAHARQIIAGTRDPLAAIVALVEWVGTARATTEDHYPDALRTIEEHAGNTNELVVAFTTMARAVGVPTKIVGGLLFDGETFFHHSWVEMFLDDWTPVDPVFGQIPADAAHIRLVDGLNRPIPFLQTTGQLSLEVLDVRR